MEELEALAQELLPEDHAMRAHLDRSMRMLQVIYASHRLQLVCR